MTSNDLRASPSVDGDEVVAPTMAESTDAPLSVAPAADRPESATRVSIRMVSSTGASGHEEHFQTPVITIGRRVQNQVVLNDLTVSSQHAEIRSKADGTGYEIHDLGSRNGTLVGGTAVAQQELKHGDIIEIGIFRLEFRVAANEAGGVLDAVAEAQLDYLSGAMSGIRQRLDRAITRVSASGKVVVIARRKSGWFVTHLEGESRTLINGMPLGVQATPLAHDDILDMNTTRIRFRLL